MTRLYQRTCNRMPEIRTPGVICLPCLFMVVMLLSIMACDKIYDNDPARYPAKFTFSGQITTRDSVPIPFLLVSFRKPGEADSLLFTGDADGKYMFNIELEVAGPNKLRIRDVDGTANGGAFAGADTTFYISAHQYETRKVMHNFILELK